MILIFSATFKMSKRMVLSKTRGVGSMICKMKEKAVIVRAREVGQSMKQRIMEKKKGGNF